MKKTLKEMLKFIDGEIQGDAETEISGVGGVENVKSNEITFAQNKEFFKLAEAKAGAIIVDNDLAERIETSKPLLIVDNPRFSFAQIASLFVFKPYHSQGISKKAYIDDSVKLGKNLSIHPNVVIEAGAEIGDNVVLGPGVYIGHNVKIGEDSILHPNVVVEYDSKLGKRVEVHPSTTIGCEGYGFEMGKDAYIKVPQMGNVIIQDDVEIGANVTIDRAATGSTIIGKGTKIDNLVHIAHNVEVGRNCLIIAQVGIAGSAKIGNKVTIAGKSGVVGHITVGDNTTLAANSVITNNVSANSFVSGYPAHDHRMERRIKASRKKLPDLVKKVRKLEKKVELLESKLNKEG
ncbi:UDP-3-O-(3-hydroxymyristoyl)glucosamine N-acyltransferase [Orenia marismortui]|uniref:UDP-3-O-acylglucosamine N-acyltransferase n=1 Tax=Orenia marismortui TaxID=46469 RepID=A0A4R8HQW1_9FIRM|nr:UDP-3-O-(3-hydroxymyristoyl)glucosamine N-acyltransferase [Orenia marismortui]TDX59193.1 UDP-3-O-[3-hydroxymyristoyl] glucosamine N-acyltransferase [Orenia marismortui]